MQHEEEVVDLDPHRTVTYLENGIPHCYMGHAECYDAHTSERLSDEADWEVTPILSIVPTPKPMFTDEELNI